MPPRGYCFDLYGTLLEYGDLAAAWGDWRAALHRTLSAQGYRGTGDDLAGACEDFFARPLGPPAADDPPTVYERRLARLYGELGVTPDPARLAAATSATIPAWQRHMTLDPVAHPVLAALADTAPLALVTNFDHPGHVRQVLAATGLEDFFTAVVISAEVGVDKPDPAIFGPALAALALPPAAVCHVGDDEVDVLAAAAAGLRAVRIVRPGRVATGDGLPPHRVVRSLRELLPDPTAL